MTTDAKSVGALLLESGESIVTAESCTGGLVADSLTQIVGASSWYFGGWVTYSNEMKVSQLGVREELLEQYGAVSFQVAKAMCEGAAKQGGANVGVSTTGVAGPGGGSEAKPVGTVFIGCTHNGATLVQEFHFSGSRDEIRQQSSSAALLMARRVLQGDSLQ